VEGAVEKRLALSGAPSAAPRSGAPGERRGQPAEARARRSAGPEEISRAWDGRFKRPAALVVLPQPSLRAQTFSRGLAGNAPHRQGKQVRVTVSLVQSRPVAKEVTEVQSCSAELQTSFSERQWAFHIWG